MRLGGLLETEDGFAAVAPMRVATRQQGALGNPHAVLVPTQLNLRKRNNHDTATVAFRRGGVKVMINA